MAADTIPVEYLFTVRAGTSVSGLIPDAPYGLRAIVEVTGGSFEGPKMKGTVKGPAGDWLTLVDDQGVTWLRGQVNTYGEIHSYGLSCAEELAQHVRMAGFRLRVRPG